MNTMCKFKLKDPVRVIDPNEHHFDEVGIVTDRDPEFVVCYRVKFPSGLTAYFAAAALVLAPNEGEF
ncbi:hypothetical protein [Paeniglutamicibacter terrestris]|uniref:Uncharacterized protein n=1 Tax=Paeniglutamicibacter terrestris TaxID=2723403 RepID=A0ABX1G4Y4_9MICC|nr:hypothetical protein [Paeniglutamicibacter terrestris]NKG21068.1 hypothetical protein [Paeniglutamicibacter terrestris]